MVSYDLKTPEKDYSALIQALQEGYRSYWHCLGSMWLIVADQNHTQVRDYLVQHIDTNDQLIVADLGGNAAWPASTRSVRTGSLTTFGHSPAPMP
jgi:hypothetical protein